MTTQFTRTAQVVAVALFVTVVTQVVYITLSNLGIEPNRQVIWSLEVLTFIAIGIGGLALVPARPVVGGAVAAGGLLNTIQAGMGLVMFPALADTGAGFGAVLAMAFLLYFAAKVALGVAAVAAGLLLWRECDGAARLVGAAAALAGLAAIAANAMAIALEADLTMVAGAAGTLAALLLAAALVPVMRCEPTPAA